MVAANKWRRWTAEDDARLRVLRQERLTYEVIGRAMERTKASVMARARFLGLASKKTPNWTPAEEARLLTMLEAHQSHNRIARKLKRSRGAVIVRCMRLGVTAQTVNGRSVTQTAALMGVDSKAVAWWANQGWLTAHASGLQFRRGECRIVEWDDLAAFLENEEFWDVWEPERIQDRGLRAWTAEMRKGVRFLTTAEAGDALGLSEGAVNLAVRQGRIRGVKHGPNWKVRSDWLILPERRTPRPRRSLTAADIGYVIEQWGKRPATVIAKDLNSTGSHVGQIAQRLGLEQFGRGYWRKVRAGTTTA